MLSFHVSLLSDAFSWLYLNVEPGAARSTGWVILSLTGVLLPQYYDKVFTYCQPASFGEVALMLWLLIRGARPPALEAAALSSAAA
ncbi:MAG: hypothetical protein DMG49_21405 [Acidobacteria bacterium]|nr:MAG: hypothetical protein DMG49_21405 [Acidobacteriota bacterium]